MLFVSFFVIRLLKVAFLLYWRVPCRQYFVVVLVLGLLLSLFAAFILPRLIDAAFDCCHLYCCISIVIVWSLCHVFSYVS
jgi:hypothetical protein